MKHLLLLIYPALLLVFTFYGAKFSGRGKMAPDFLRLGQTRMIQAAACIGIIIHHVTQRITAYEVDFRRPITIFNNLGFIFTAIFFFCSGYGLLTSLNTRPGYLKGFLKRRLPAVLVPFWTINLLLVLADVYIYHVRMTVPSVLKDIFGITLVNSNGWFVIEIVVFYLMFRALFSLIEKKDAALALMCAGVVFLILFAFFRGHDPEGSKAHWFKGEWWFNSSFTFVFGLLYARFKARIDAFCGRHYPGLLTLFAVLTPVSVFASTQALSWFGYYHAIIDHGLRDAAVTLIVQTITCLVCTMLVLLLNMRITLGNRALAYVAGIRLPLFLIHGYFISRVFAHIRMSDFARYGIVILCGIASASLLTPPIDFLIGKVTGILNAFPFPRRIVNDTLEARNAELRRLKRIRRLKIAAMICLPLCLAAALFMTVGRPVLDKRTCREECSSLREAKIGDIVYWGRFETNPSRPGKERMTWIVIRREEERVWLLSEKGIAGSWYNQKHVAVSWEDSDLHALLQSPPFTGIFSEPEAALVIPAGEPGVTGKVCQEQEGPAGEPRETWKVGQEGPAGRRDLLTLLTPSEAMEVFETDRDRELVLTESAELAGTNINRLSKANEWDMKGYRSSWWWLRGEDGSESVMAPIVTVDGVVLPEGNEVNRPGGAVRPVVWIRLKEDG